VAVLGCLGRSLAAAGVFAVDVAAVACRRVSLDAGEFARGLASTFLLHATASIALSTTTFTIE